MYSKEGIAVLKETAPKSSPIQIRAKQVIQPVVNVGDQRTCPECQTVGRVVWVSQDKKTMGVQCRMSHRDAERPATKFGATIVRSTKTRKNIVFMTAAA